MFSLKLCMLHALPCFSRASCVKAGSQPICSKYACSESKHCHLNTAHPHHFETLGYKPCLNAMVCPEPSVCKHELECLVSSSSSHERKSLPDSVSNQEFLFSAGGSVNAHCSAILQQHFHVQQLAALRGLCRSSLIKLRARSAFVICAIFSDVLLTRLNMLRAFVPAADAPHFSGCESSGPN